MNKSRSKRRRTSSFQRPFFSWLLAFAMLTGAGVFFSDAATTVDAATATNGNTVSTPVPKPPAQAIQDLKKNPPLDPLKIGDPMPANLFVELSKLINPAVVSITTTQALRQSQTRYRDPLQDFLEDFWGGRGGGPNFGGPPQSRRQPVTALGTGFIIREDGLIITNNHVVEQADVIKVQVGQTGEEFYEAEVVGRDSRTDIALIKINAKKALPVAPLGSSKDVQVGEWVAAFGNPYGHAHTMTKGIVSAIGREIGELNRFPFLQTDASINPGNSGGPLVNTRGQVIGVNTAIDARAQGIGFAIPIDNVKQIVQVLEKEGRISRGFIGINIASVTPEIAAGLGMQEPEGVVVTQILRDSPADQAGMKPYDIILEFGGKKTPDAVALQNAVGDTEIGSSAKAKVLRFNNKGQKRELSVDVKVTENPEDKRKTSKPEKQYFGQKAPFDLGFKIADLTPKLAEEFQIPPDAPQGPVITEVERKSSAAEVGLQPGDVILDVNRQPVTKATDVVKLLKKGRNTVRIARGDTVAILPLGK